MGNTYSIRAVCSNCGKYGYVNIPKGNLVSSVTDFSCENCGNTTLRAIV